MFRYKGDADGTVRFYLSGNGINTYRVYFLVQNKTSVLTFVFNGTTFKVYEDNVELTVTVEFGSVPSSLFTTNIGTLIGGSYDDATGIPSIIYNAVTQYNVAVTEDTRGRIYQYFKQRFQL